ncbi:MAG: CsiV family protein [Gammaproteobacteria bacterium]|nr:CsiV family protein [Gammaproteobacteria bacterium]MCY4217807.1 CsiV family protein [Gammaproteobacteria bacterium]MCY4274917.1 CsiV family protein [Gammaproteobacteria bacterium]
MLLIGLQSVAHSSNYEIEVIVFERPDSKDLDLEYWNFSSEHLKEQRSHLNEMEQSRNLSRLSESSAYNGTQKLQRLSEFIRKLNINNLPVLASARWIQPPFFFQNAPVISLGTVGSRLPHAYFRVYKTSLLFADIALQLSTKSTRANLSTPKTLIEKPQENPESGFDPEYLFDTWPVIESLDPEYYLIERRRIRFKEVHYFDHPAFGVILGIWSTN